MALGEAWGRLVEAGWVVALTGDLGAGKTQLVRGLARGLGSVARVHSPTFALLHTYGGGRWPLHHLDLYRLENPESVMQAGLETYLYPRGAVAVVEWAERWYERPSTGCCAGVRVLRWVRMEAVTEDVRLIRYEDFGA